MYVVYRNFFCHFFALFWNNKTRVVFIIRFFLILITQNCFKSKIYIIDSNLKKSSDNISFFRHAPFWTP